MKRCVFIFAFISLIVSGCSKEQAFLNVAPYKAEDDLQKFAIILSKAVSNEPDLCEFIKNEALEMCDHDYDVLLIKVKDEIVSGNSSFSEILSKYADDESLDAIISRVPNINILVPDWSWAGEKAFSVKSWDTSSEDVTVSFRNDNRTLPLYANGVGLQVLEEGYIPTTPTLIVKTNERVQIEHDTKSGDYGFSFIHFENSNEETKTVLNFGIEAASGAISGNAFNGRLASLFADTDGVPGLTQRDYLYYHMSAEETIGVLDNTVNERIYAFKVNNLDTRYIVDEVGAYNDFNTGEGPNAFYNFAESASRLSRWNLSSLLWFEGALDINFEISAGEYQSLRVYTYNFNDLFALNTVEEHYIGGKYYYVVHKDSFVPRWAYVQADLFVWDLLARPMEYKINVVEFDDSASYSETETVTTNYATNFNFSSEVGANVGIASVKLGFGVSLSNSEQRTHTQTWVRNEASDMLGSCHVHYNDPIVQSQPVAGGSYNTSVKVYDTGTVSFVILPRCY